MAQSIKPGLQLQEDSVAIARHFVANAKPLLDSLTALHFARLRIGFLENQVKQREGERDGLARELADCRANTGKQIISQVDDKGKISQLKSKGHNSQLQLWLTRAALALSLYWHLKR